MFISVSISVMRLRCGSGPGLVSSSQSDVCGQRSFVSELRERVVVAHQAGKGSRSISKEFGSHK